MARHLSKNVLELMRFRQRRRISQERLSRMTGLSVNTIRRIERGEGFQTKSLLKIATALNLNITMSPEGLRFSEAPPEPFVPPEEDGTKPRNNDFNWVWNDFLRGEIVTDPIGSETYLHYRKLCPEGLERIDRWLLEQLP